MIRYAFALALLLGGTSPTVAGYYALLIANNEYEHWPDLRTPGNDVAVLDEILRQQYGFQTTVLSDATRGEIIDEIETMNDRLTDDDSLMIYYAGHGYLREDGGYWIGTEATTGSRSGWLKYDAINDLIDSRGGAAARHVLVVADSCYSGAALRSAGPESAPDPNETRDNWLARMNERRSRTVLTSGGTEPVVDAVGGADHSIFAAEFLDRLRINNEVLDASSLYDTIKSEVHARARRVLSDDAQAPEYGSLAGTGHQGGDFLFIPAGLAPPRAGTGSSGGGDFGLRGPTLIAHQEGGPIHIGDEFIESWEPTSGPCYEIGFDYSGRVETLTLDYDVYGAEETVLVFEGRQYPFESQIPKTGRTRPNYWENGKRLQIPVGATLAGSARLQICSSLVANPDVPDDRDDFRLRNVLLRVN